jgi:hypothetical protein
MRGRPKKLDESFDLKELLITHGVKVIRRSERPKQVQGFALSDVSVVGSLGKPFPDKTRTAKYHTKC